MTLRGSACRRPALLALVLAVLVSGCGFLPGPQIEVAPPDRPEMFEFFMQPGTGVGDRADDLVKGLGPGRIVPGSAVHVASVRTPRGLSHVVTMESREDGGMHCIGSVTPGGGSATCSSVETVENLASGHGWGSDGVWNETQFSGPDGTEKIVVTTEDGTMYTVHTHDGFGILIWPAMRGSITKLVALDSDGAELQISELPG